MAKASPIVQLMWVRSNTLTYRPCQSSLASLACVLRVFACRLSSSAARDISSLSLVASSHANLTSFLVASSADASVMARDPSSVVTGNLAYAVESGERLSNPGACARSPLGSELWCIVWIRTPAGLNAPTRCEHVPDSTGMPEAGPS